MAGRTAYRGNKGNAPALDESQARKVAHLIDDQGMTFTAVSERFGVSRTAVKNAYARQKEADGTAAPKPEAKKRPRDERGLFCGK